MPTRLVNKPAKSSPRFRPSYNRTFMSMMRSAILAGAQSGWLRQNAPRFPFVRRTASRFMPGEQLPDALEAARLLAADGVATLVTHLGENISDEAEARAETQVYLDILDRIREMRLPCEPSVKLTQLGLDLSSSQCYGNLVRIVEHAGPETMVWIDMESSSYVDITLELFRRTRCRHPNVGVCLQAYLFRTEKDLSALMPLGPAIRLVKGAYQEPPDRAIPRKADVDANYLHLARALLGHQARQAGAKPAFATHDHELIQAINAVAVESAVP